MPTRAYLAIEGYEDELKEELGSGILSQHGRLIVADEPSRAPAWAQNTWLAPQELEIKSVGDGVKQLRALAPWWSLYSHRFHRRAQLLQEQLPRVKNPPLEFLAPLPSRALGSWTLIAPDRILASPQCTSLIPNGEIVFNEDKTEPPSRAYLKLWELFTVYGVRPKAGDKCIDLGATPGGWTWVLAKVGCKVLAVDRAPLADSVAAMPNVEFMQRNAFTLKPEDVGELDWLFSDIICFPEQLEELVQTWRASGLVKNFVCTIKFKGETDHAITSKFASIPGARVQHLCHNKHEITWWLTNETR